MHLWKTCPELIVGMGKLCSASGYISPSPRLWKKNFYKKPHLHIFCWPIRDFKITTYLQLAQNWIFQKPMLTKFFLSTFPATLRRYAKKLKVSRLVMVWTLNLSIKKQRYKVLANKWQCLWKIGISKAIVDISNAGRQCWLSTSYIKHSLFHPSKSRRDIELQKKHIVRFKSTRDVMRVSTLSAQLGLGSELVDCYWDATSVPYGHLLIDLSQRTDHQLRCCTSSGSIPSNFNILQRLKQLNSLDHKHKNYFYSLSVLIVFPQMQHPILSVSSERVYPVYVNA